MIAVGFFFIR